MVQIINNIFDIKDVQHILNLPEVLSAKQKIDSRSSGTQYFSIDITPDIQQTLLSIFNLNLTKVPMRWIKGDIPHHKDKGPQDFNNTYLIYLTDNEGSLVLDNTSYPITQNTGYIFQEGLSHETINTGNTPRLLMGPMSEQGFAVGTGIFRPGGTTVYFRQTRDIQYSIDNQASWISLGNNYPIVIGNTNTSAGILTIEFITDINLNNTLVDAKYKYFACNSDNIQFGSSSLKLDGTRPKITIDSGSDYSGLINNGGAVSNGFNNIYIYNIEVLSINGSTLDNLTNSNGWVAQAFFAKNATTNYIINCYSDGNIPPGAGGIVGSYAAQNSGSLTIIGCSSSGTIGESSGGIVGRYAAQNSGSVQCQKCWSQGLIAADAGGIFAQYSNGASSANSCYSTGNIGFNAGGIFGSFAAGENLSAAFAQNCYSLGNVSIQAGGIFGFSAATSSSNAFASNCYSAGIVSTFGNGIYGSNKGNGSENNCYTADGSWNSIVANTTLINTPSPIIGDVWTQVGTNQPYELTDMGYSPYTIFNIDTSGTPTLNKFFNQSVNSGSSTSPAIISGKSYTILAIKNGGTFGSYSDITIDSTTGVVSTTSGTTAGLYTVYVRNTGSYNITELNLSVTSFVVCFEENTKILVLTDDKEVYVPIKDLKQGDLVKTFMSGYKAIDMIGRSVVYNNGLGDRTTDKLYRCSKENYAELFEDLLITGYHSILVDDLTPDQIERTIELMKDIFVTENKYRLIACVDERSVPYEVEGTFNIYHIALENDDYYMNYGVYANGLLVETCSRRFLKELSNMTLL